MLETLATPLGDVGTAVADDLFARRVRVHAARDAFRSNVESGLAVLERLPSTNRRKRDVARAFLRRILRRVHNT